MPGFTAPKLIWIARHEPKVFARVAKVLLPKAYVRYRLTGEMVEDMSDAAGTLWLDVGQRCWSETALKATGLELHHMPRLVEGSDVSAHLSSDFARRWGMASGVVVAGGAGDCAASAIGLGAIAPGDAFLSLGTSGVALPGHGPVCTRAGLGRPRVLPRASWSVAPDGCHVVGRRLARLARNRHGNTGFRAARPARRDRRTGRARSSFCPISTASARHTMTPPQPAPSSVFAARRDATISFRPCWKASPLPRATISLRLGGAICRSREVDFVGGGSRSALWAQISADVLGIPVHRVEEGEVGAALGAARLGRIAATGAHPAEVCVRPRRLATFMPRASAVAAYDEAYHQWRKLYPALKEFSL